MENDIPEFVKKVIYKSQENFNKVHWCRVPNQGGWEIELGTYSVDVWFFGWICDLIKEQNENTTETCWDASVFAERNRDGEEIIVLSITSEC